MGAARLSRLARCGVAMATRRQTPQCQSSLDFLRCTDGPMARPLAQLQVEKQHREQRSSVFEKRQLRTAAKSSSDGCGQVGYSWQAIKGKRGNQGQSPSGRSSRRDAWSLRWPADYGARASAASATARAWSAPLGGLVRRRQVEPRHRTPVGSSCRARAMPWQGPRGCSRAAAPARATLR